MNIVCRLWASTTDSIVVDGNYRSFIVHLPTGYIATHHYPLVLNLHGYTSDAYQAELYTGMDAVADQNGFIVVYPNGMPNPVQGGVGRYWNSWGSGADDVKYISVLLDTLSMRYSINPKRIYSCGMSNGGYMSYTLACQLSTKIAAIAPVSGTMSNYTYSNCSPTRKVPVMHIHGTADPTVPYDSGATASKGVEATLAYWLSYDACSTVSDTVALPDINTSDSSTVQKIDYRTCGNNTEVLFYKIKGGGHTWPGAPLAIPAYGNTNKDIKASVEIWSFFNKYSLDGLNGIEDMTQSSSISVYPNPTNGKLTVYSAIEIESMDVVNMMGQSILRTKGSSADVSILPQGSYMVIATRRDKAVLHTTFIKE